MKEIQLTRNKITFVDNEDFEELSKSNWCADFIGKTCYAVRVSYRKKIYMHHQIIGKPPKGFVTDHMDTDGLNNQRNNLQFITHRENLQYTKRANISSQYPGVCWDKSRNKWETRIRINGRSKYLGRFINEQDAYATYKQAVSDIENPPLSIITIEELLETIKKVKELTTK